MDGAPFSYTGITVKQPFQEGHYVLFRGVHESLQSVLAEKRAESKVLVNTACQRAGEETHTLSTSS